MERARTASRPFDWAAKRRAALFSLCINLICATVLSSKTLSVVLAGQLRVPIVGWSLDQPQWLYPAVAVLMLLIGVCLFSAYRDWKFRRLTTRRLSRHAGRI